MRIRISPKLNSWLVGCRGLHARELLYQYTATEKYYARGAGGDHYESRCN